jgi:hypothetical protein
MFSLAIFALAPLFAAVTASPVRRAGGACSWQLIHPYGDSSLVCAPCCCRHTVHSVSFVRIVPGRRSGGPPERAAEWAGDDVGSVRQRRQRCAAWVLDAVEHRARSKPECYGCQQRRVHEHQWLLPRRWLDAHEQRAGQDLGMLPWLVSAEVGVLPYWVEFPHC